jgi:hypothetical protein
VVVCKELKVEGQMCLVGLRTAKHLHIAVLEGCGRCFDVDTAPEAAHSEAEPAEPARPAGALVIRG